MRGTVGSLWVPRPPPLIAGRLGRDHPRARYRVAEVAVAMTDVRDHRTEEALPRPLRRPAEGVEVGPEGATTVEVTRAGGEVAPGEDAAGVPEPPLAPLVARMILMILRMAKGLTSPRAHNLVPDLA